MLKTIISCGLLIGSDAPLCAEPLAASASPAAVAAPAEVAPQTAAEARLRKVFREMAFSGQMVGMLQGAFNVEPKERVDAIGKATIEAGYVLDPATRVFISLEAAGGDGPDADFASYSRLNRIAGRSNDTARVAEAWGEATLLDGALTLKAGQLDLRHYLDQNAVAGDENSQFVTTAFVSSVAAGLPENGPGVVAGYALDKEYSLVAAYSSTDTTANDLLSHGYTALGVSYATTFDGLAGNYRLMGFLDDRRADGVDKLKDRSSLGAALSIDQELATDIKGFARLALRNAGANRANLSWSLGLQSPSSLPGRSGDLVGVALGQTRVHGAGSEKAFEAYYSVKQSDNLAIVPSFQMIIDPLGDKRADDATALGIRAVVTF